MTVTQNLRQSLRKAKLSTSHSHENHRMCTSPHAHRMEVIHPISTSFLQIHPEKKGPVE